MWSFERIEKLVLALVISLAILLSLTYDNVGACFLPVRTATATARCSVFRRCPNRESVVWATDNRTCSVWRNSCQLANENCRLRSRNIRALRNVTKSTCQTMCGDACTQNLDPVCAEYNGDQETFSNRCLMNSYVCKSGKIFEYLFKGQCPTKTTVAPPTVKPTTKP